MGREEDKKYRIEWTQDNIDMFDYYPNIIEARIAMKVLIEEGYEPVLYRA